MLSLIPAYGRDYKSKKEVQTAWDNLQDFRISDVSSQWHGRAANKSDATALGVDAVKIRYARLSRVHVIKVEV